MRSFDIEILNKIPGVFLWEKDIDSNFLWANEMFSKILCALDHPQDIQGRSDQDLFDDGDTSRYQAEDREAVSFKKSIKIFETIHSKKMEAPKICITTKIPRFNTKNDPIGTFGISIDVTHSLFKISQFLFNTHWDKSNSGVSQNSYRINQNEIKNIKLTPRESDCLFFLIRHKSAKEIARILKLSPRTVECYINNIKEKLNACNKSEIFDKAVEYGFFNVVPERILIKNYLSY